MPPEMQKPRSVGALRGRTFCELIPFAQGTNTMKISTTLQICKQYPHPLSQAIHEQVATEATAFDPTRFPIIAKHWPDLLPESKIGRAA